MIKYCSPGVKLTSVQVFFLTKVISLFFWAKACPEVKKKEKKIKNWTISQKEFPVTHVLDRKH